VPYKDSFVTDVMAQRIDVAFDASTGAIPNLKGGKIRALAVTSSKRIPQLPDVPAISETYPGYTGDSWHGLFAPKGTPPEVIDVLAKHSQQIVASPDFQSTLQTYALTPVGSSPKVFQKFVVEDARTWAKVVRDNRIAVD
jgi:tripartite-type tricarboxylate transporter receptor subunit TctC